MLGPTMERMPTHHSIRLGSPAQAFRERTPAFGGSRARMLTVLTVLGLQQALAGALPKAETLAQGIEDRRLHLLPWLADSQARAPLDDADAVRAALRFLQSAEAVTAAPGADALHLIDKQRLRSGAQLLRFAPFRDGIALFGEGITVLLDAEGRARASSGGGRGQDWPVGLRAPGWTLQAGDAAAQALTPWGFDPASLRGAWAEPVSRRATGDAFRRIEPALMLRRSASGAELAEPVRLKPIWYRRGGLLQPAWYVETAVLPAQGPASSVHHGIVIDARSGEIHSRQPLSAHASFVWQAYAESSGEKRPQPGPQGRADMPHPTALPDGFTPSFGPPPQVALAFAPLNSVWPGLDFADPWLRVRDFETRGNNVDAYADLNPPDGFSEGDMRAQLTGPATFAPGYSLQLPPDADKPQITAGIVNAFYLTNYLHDWFYPAGFDEAAGNAQMSNFGRGGLEFDELRVETLDYSGIDNANMVTPADGASPRMQLFRFRGPLLAALDPGAAGPPLRVQVAGFGPQTYRVSGALAGAEDSVGDPLDGCEALVGDYSGRIALINRGGCTFAQKALNAQAAGALGALIANSDDNGWPSMAGDAPGLNIPAQGLTRTDGQWLRERLAQGPLAVEQYAERAPDRDAAMDAAIVAHEWGHYISNRLIGDGAGLSNHQARAMGEGWADFHALLLLVREEDAQTSAGADYAGSYGVMNFVSAGRMPSFSPNASYFGIRRFPYSTRRSINPLELQHIATNAELPTSAPRTLGIVSADNSSVHNAGEVWGSLLWDCYAGLLRDTLPPNPRMGFFEAQRRMSEYLVAGYKLTPNAPTYTEARDALLAVMAVSDLEDLRLCGAAFAARGAGLRAKSPSRFSLTLQGVQPSRIDGGDLAIDSIELLEAASCDQDGILDPGETGTLRLRLRNTGTQSLVDSVLDVTTEASRLRFTEGHRRALPPTQPQQQVTVDFAVALGSGAGRQAISVDATPDDPGIGFATGEPRTDAFAVDFDLRDFVSRSDSFESPRLVWTAAQDEGLDGNIVGWRRRALNALDWALYGPDFGSEGQAWVESPTLAVRTDQDFSIEFSARYSFEADVSTWYDGGLIEYSVDAGASWQDVSSIGQLSPAYGGELSDCCDNPLGGRPAFVGKSEGWPDDFLEHRIDFGRSLAGQQVRLRFLIATDAAVSAPGWEIDRVSALGIANSPFPQLVADAGACTLNGSFRDGFEDRP
jgi:hypothetical protein